MKLAPHIVDLLVHIQHAGFEVQVIPLQRHQLTPAQAGGQVQKEDLVVALELRLNEEPLQLFPSSAPASPVPFFGGSLQPMAGFTRISPSCTAFSNAERQVA